MDAKRVKPPSPTDGMRLDALAKLKIQRKFEIFVEEYTEAEGNRPAGWYPVKMNTELGGYGNPIITVNCQKDLAEKSKFYADVGQRFRIVREIDPPSREDIIAAAKEQGIDLGLDDKQEKPAESAAPSAQASSAPAPKAEPPRQAKAAKIVTVGGVQIKYDGDRVYQRQWVRLTPAEEANFRVVSDASNKLVPMSGRHIEARRWVLVEEEAADAADAEDVIDA